MRKPFPAVALFSILAVASLGWATASEDYSEPLQADPSGMPGGSAKFNKKALYRNTGPGPLPSPVEPQSAASRPISLKGPVTMADPSTGSSFGSALVAPRGGAMSSPRQRADREIRRLIRRLD